MASKARVLYKRMGRIMGGYAEVGEIIEPTPEEWAAFGDKLEPIEGGEEPAALQPAPEQADAEAEDDDEDDD